MKKLGLLFKFFATGLNYLYYTPKVKKVDYFDLANLIYPNYKVPYGFGSVMIYGNWKAVAKLKGSRYNFIREYLEHGLQFYDDYNAVPALGYVDRKAIKTIYTYSEDRKIKIEKYLNSINLKKKVVTVGPYIKGADFFHSESELKEIKDKYGKILLVYPMHSMEGASAQFSANEFFEKILQIQDQFDSVFVCVYWKNLLTQGTLIDLCQKNNFTIVSNGHRSDPMFLSRQKDLIFLSDMIMTNGIGTHIGYAICMDRPVYFYNQETDYQLDNNPYAEIVKNNQPFLDDLKSSFMQLFGEPSFEITQEQIKLVQKYWGFWK